MLNGDQYVKMAMKNHQENQSDPKAMYNTHEKRVCEFPIGVRDQEVSPCEFLLQYQHICCYLQAGKGHFSEGEWFHS